MLVSPPYDKQWLSLGGQVTKIVDMKDMHLMAVVMYVGKLVRGAWLYQQPEEPVSYAAPGYVKLGYGQGHENLLPSFYWNAVAELKSRGLY